MKKLILATALFLTATITGCASSGTNTANQAPLAISLITAEAAKGCRFVGVASGHVYNAFTWASNNIAAARTKAAEEARAAGGNSAVLTATDVANPGHNVTVHMDSYECI